MIYRYITYNSLLFYTLPYSFLFNPFLQTGAFWHIRGRQHLKTLCRKEELLYSIIVSSFIVSCFSNIFVKICFQSEMLSLILSQIPFDTICSRWLLKTLWQKVKDRHRNNGEVITKCLVGRRRGNWKLLKYLFVCILKYILI